MRLKPHIYFMFGKWLILSSFSAELDYLAIDWCYEMDERT